jgi:hypothetical protein
MPVRVQKVDKGRIKMVPFRFILQNQTNVNNPAPLDSYMNVPEGLLVVSDSLEADRWSRWTASSFVSLQVILFPPPPWTVQLSAWETGSSFPLPSPSYTHDWTPLLLWRLASSRPSLACDESSLAAAHEIARWAGIDPTTVRVVAPGASCRTQWAQATVGLPAPSSLAWLSPSDLWREAVDAWIRRTHPSWPGLVEWSARSGTCPACSWTCVWHAEAFSSRWRGAWRTPRPWTSESDARAWAHELAHSPVAHVGPSSLLRLAGQDGPLNPAVRVPFYPWTEGHPVPIDRWQVIPEWIPPPSPASRPPGAQWGRDPGPSESGAWGWTGHRLVSDPLPEWRPAPRSFASRWIPVSPTWADEWDELHLPSAWRHEWTPEDDEDTCQARVSAWWTNGGKGRWTPPTGPTTQLREGRWGRYAQRGVHTRACPLSSHPDPATDAEWDRWWARPEPSARRTRELTPRWKVVHSSQGLRLRYRPSRTSSRWIPLPPDWGNPWTCDADLLVQWGQQHLSHASRLSRT